VPPLSIGDILCQWGRGQKRPPRAGTGAISPLPSSALSFYTLAEPLQPRDLSDFSAKPILYHPLVGEIIAYDTKIAPKVRIFCSRASPPRLLDFRQAAAILLMTDVWAISACPFRKGVTHT
jgi:hypothetical protein